MVLDWLRSTRKVRGEWWRGEDNRARRCCSVYCIRRQLTSADSLDFLVAADVIYVCIFFFFQAEDGIRDLTVTGVQTCALPISAGGPPPGARRPGGSAVSARSDVLLWARRVIARQAAPAHQILEIPDDAGLAAEIGRASCRERV